MTAAIALRCDFTGSDLRRLARRTDNARQARRLLALAEIYDGGSRSDAARIGDVGLQIVRDWVLRFNADGPDGLIDRKAPGPEPRLTAPSRSPSRTAIIQPGSTIVLPGFFIVALPVENGRTRTCDLPVRSGNHQPPAPRGKIGDDCCSCSVR